jgi:hypothetical protein
VRPDRVVVAPPALDDDLGLAESLEDFAVEQLIAQASVEALDVAVLPGGAPLDVVDFIKAQSTDWGSNPYYR